MKLKVWLKVCIKVAILGFLDEIHLRKLEVEVQILRVYPVVGRGVIYVRSDSDSGLLSNKLASLVK